MTFTFCCDECKVCYDYEYSRKEVDCGKLSELKYCVDCSSELKRDYSGVRVNADQGKFDPKSTNYWKRGKTNSHIADVLNGKKPMP